MLTKEQIKADPDKSYVKCPDCGWEETDPDNWDDEGCPQCSDASTIVLMTPVWIDKEGNPC